jgi:hypothetical protein
MPRGDNGDSLDLFAKASGRCGGSATASCGEPTGPCAPRDRPLRQSVPTTMLAGSS